MNDKILENLFSNLLDAFPFSIKGYENAEDEFAAAFKRLYQNEFLTKQNHFTFLISGFAKLKEEINQDLDFENWDTKALKKFLFHDFQNGLAEFALSIYIYALRVLSPDKSVNKLITSNFRNNVVLSVKIKDGIDFVALNFIAADNTLEIQVPNEFFKQLHFNFEDYRNLFSTEGKEVNPFLVKEDADNPSEFEIVPNDSVNSQYEILLEQIMTITPISFRVQLDKMDFENDSHFKSIRKNHLHNESASLRDLLIVGYVNSILCHLYQSNIYYFLSVAMVNRNMKYTLGGIGVGTKPDDEITKETMSFFNIVSNHISSNLAVQIIYDNIELLKLEVESYKAAILTQPLGKSLYALNQTLNNKVPFAKSGIHYKHVRSLIDYAKSNSIEESTVWKKIQGDVINVFDTVINRIGELNGTWSKLKSSIQQENISETEKYFVEIESLLESKIVIDNNPVERIYFTTEEIKVELFFVKHHINSFIKGIRKNATTWQGLTSDGKLKSVHKFIDGKLSVIFHVGKEPVTDFETFKVKATESEQYEKLGGMITLLNKLYHAEIKFVSKNDSSISSLHYSKGVNEPNEITSDSGMEYSELENGLHYQIIFK